MARVSPDPSLKAVLPLSERFMSFMALRVLVVDDHESVRRGVCAILGSRQNLEICGEASDGNDAVEKTRALKPDLIVMDISMPVMDGISAARDIRKFSPDTAIIILSMHDSNQLVETAKGMGLRGYVTKSEVAASLLHAVDSVVAGKPFFP